MRVPKPVPPGFVDTLSSVNKRSRTSAGHSASGVGDFHSEIEISHARRVRAQRHATSGGRFGNGIVDQIVKRVVKQFVIEFDGHQHRVEIEFQFTWAS
jgi:hypothetical protein